MKISIIVLVLLLSNSAFPQGGSLTIYNLETQKERVIKENKRIIITMVNGEKVKGRFTVVDERTIMLNENSIELSEIGEIKRNPLLLSLVTGVVFIVGGVALAVTGVFVPTPINVLLFLSGSLVAYFGSQSFKVLTKAFQRTDNWSYSIHL